MRDTTLRDDAYGERSAPTPATARGHRPLRLLAAAAACAAGVCAAGSAIHARADNPNTITLTATCDNGQTVTVELEGATPGNSAFPSGLRVVSDTSVFTIHQFVITDLVTGQSFTIKNDSGVANNKDLVSCSRTGVRDAFTWTGFFTPAS